MKIKAEQVNAEIYKGEVAEREHVFQYTIENTGDKLYYIPVLRTVL